MVAAGCHAVGGARTAISDRSKQLRAAQNRTSPTEKEHLMIPSLAFFLPRAHFAIYSSSGASFVTSLPPCCLLFIRSPRTLAVVRGASATTPAVASFTTRTNGITMLFLLLSFFFILCVGALLYVRRRVREDSAVCSDAVATATTAYKRYFIRRGFRTRQKTTRV